MEPIALSKARTIKTPYTNGRSEFRSTFWKNFNNLREYQERKTNILGRINQINQNKQYFKVKIEKVTNHGKSIASSNIPSNIREKSNMDIVGQKDNEIYIRKNDINSFAKFQSIVQNSSYNNAKENVSTQKKGTLSREVYAIEELDNIAFEDKVSDIIVNYNEDTNIDVIVELYADIKYHKAQSIIRQIQVILGYNVQSFTGTTDGVVSNACIRIMATKGKLQAIIAHIEEVSCIYPTPILLEQRSLSSQISEIQFSSSFLTNGIIGIFDGGVNQTMYDGLIAHTEKFEHDTNFEHGTSVASKILFGDQLDEIRLPHKGPLNLNPVGKILDIKVLNSHNGITDRPTLINNINHIINKYTDVHIYNFSLGVVRDKKFIDSLTSLLDNLANTYDKIFIISAGNSSEYEYLSNQSDTFNEILDIGHIASQRTLIEVMTPGDCINGITVGALVEKADDTCITKNIGDISPISRIGVIRLSQKIRKPDIMERGGNREFSPTQEYTDDFIKNSNLKWGTPVLDVNKKVIRDCGTSYAAPIVTNKALQILDFLEKTQMNNLFLDGNRLNIIKGLLVHKSAIKNRDIVKNDQDNMFYGYGKSPSIEEIIGDRSNEFTFVHCSDVEVKHEETTEKIHHIEFVLPELPNNKELLLQFTLCYNPPVSKDFVNEYSKINIKPSIKINGSDLTRSNYIYKNYEEHMPLKTALFKFKNWNTTNSIKIRLATKLADHFQKRINTNINQPYTIVMTIIDPAGDIDLRNKLLNTNQFEIIQEVALSVQATH